MSRRRIAALPLVVLVAILALPGCGGDKTSNPQPTQKLGNLELTLELARPTVAVSDTVTAAVFVHNADSEVLDELTYAWRWSGRSQYGAAVTGMTRALVQPATPGRLDVEVIVSDGTDTKILSAWIMVAPAAVDGSRTMITVFEGAFLRGERPDQTAFISNTPQRAITLSHFSLARTEMTNATCAEILNRMNDGDLVSPVAHPGLLTWSPGPPPWDLVLLDFSKTRLVWSQERISVPAGYELHPVTGVTWPGAAALCNWLSGMEGLEPAYTFTPTESIHLYDITCNFFANGYRLPTEAEWEKAARGALVFSDGANPLPDRRFPWGDDAPRLALAYGVPGSVRANVSTLAGTTPQPIFDGALPVGSFPLGAGPYGHLDLLGNAAEWCYDWVDPGYYASSPDVDPTGVTAVYPTVNDWKALRGDSWKQAYIPGMDAYTSEEGCGKRRWAGYTYRSGDLGFRVARSNR